MKLTYIKQGAEPAGDGGDQYVGLDRFGRVVDQRWIKNNGTALERVDYGYSRAGNRQWRWNRVATNGQDEYYNYDGLYQVKELQRGTLNSGKTGISGTPTWEEDFTYDPIGNWNAYLTKLAGVTNLDQERTHNQANETTEIDGSADTVANDPAGNMVTVPQINDWGSTNGLKWDAWNRLVEVADGDATVAQYRYDGLTRRATKTTDTTRHYFYSDHWQIMEERVNDATAAERQFVWGQRYMDDLVLRDRGSERLYVLHDYFHPTAVAAPNGTVLERYGYDAFGLSRVMTAAFNPRTASNYDWETRYGAYRWDAETGFYQVRYRYLHSTLGRWLSRDPIGETGSTNLFRYVNNRGSSAVDAYGLFDLIFTGSFTEEEACNVVAAVNAAGERAALLAKRLKALHDDIILNEIGNFQDLFGCKCWNDLLRGLRTAIDVYSKVSDDVGDPNKKLRIQQTRLNLQPQQIAQASWYGYEKIGIAPLLSLQTKPPIPWTHTSQTGLVDDILHELTHLHKTEDNDKNGRWLNAYFLDSIPTDGDLKKWGVMKTLIDNCKKQAAKEKEDREKAKKGPNK